MDCLNELEDPRRPSNGTMHDFREMLVIVVCACLSDVDHCENIALWARQKEGWLRRFLRLAKIVLNLLRLDSTPMPKKKVSLRQKRKLAAWDEDLSIAMLGIEPL